MLFILYKTDDKLRLFIANNMGVTLKDVIRSQKDNIDLGEWKNGHIPRASFPLSRLKNGQYKYGKQYNWRVVRFSALGNNFRVLIIYNEDKKIFSSRLGIERGKDIAILCRHEYHAGEPGWHCHLTTGDSDVVECGIRDPRQLKRWPQVGTKHSQPNFNVNFTNAITVVAERYNFQAQGGFL